MLAASLGLSPGEAYGIGISHVLKLSYYDHPPLSYWIAHEFIPVLGDGRALRLPFVAMFAGTSWALFLLTRQLFGPIAGVWAVLALNLTGFFTFASGWVLPDGPFMLSLMAAAYTISKSLFPVPGCAPPSPWRTWIIAGIWIGLAGLSKYQAGLFAAGLFIYLLWTRRSVLYHLAPWLGAIVAVALCAPIIIWNAQNDWASFAFQGSRALSYGSFPKLGFFLGNLGGQIAYLLPWIFVPLLIAVYKSVRADAPLDRSWYCLSLGLPAIALFSIVPLWAGRGFPHWQMPGWLMLYPLFGSYLEREAALDSRPKIWAITSGILLVALTSLLVGYIDTGYGKSLLAQATAQDDPTTEFIEWAPLRHELRQRGLLQEKGLFVVASNPLDAGQIDQALHGSMPVQVLGDSKEYAYRDDPKLLVGHDALIIGRRDKMTGMGAALKPYFVSIDELSSFKFGRSGADEIDVSISYAHGLKKPFPLPNGTRFK